MINEIQKINLIDGLNLNPIPLEVSQSMTTTKWLMAIEAKVNEMILIRNDVVADANNYTNAKYNELNNIINGLTELLNQHDDKQIHDIVVNMVNDLVKTVWFGINDDGYFYAVIPPAWDAIQFNTNQDGNLILQY